MQMSLQVVGSLHEFPRKPLSDAVRALVRPTQEGQQDSNNPLNMQPAMDVGVLAVGSITKVSSAGA